VKRSSTIVLAVAVGVVALAAGLFVGMSYGKGHPSVETAMKTVSDLTPEQMAQLGTSGGGFPGGGFPGGGFPGGAAGGGNGNARGGFTAGSIVSNDGSTITIKMNDGSTKFVLFSGSTTIRKSAEGTSADLVAGENVVVTGSANSDGSITATQIQLGGLPGGPGGGGQETTPPTS
jgi:hypothetical protein